MQSNVQPAADDITEVRTLWRLGWPVAVGGVGMLGMGAVDTAMVGSLGEGALAALSNANMWVHGLGVFGRGLLMGVDPVVTQSHGRGDSARIGGTARAALLTALLASVPLFMAYHFAAPVLSMFGQPAEILPDVASYCRAAAWGVPGWMLFWALRQLLQGMERMREATIAVLVANALNVVLNACFVHGWLGVPAMGVVGAGVATAGSSWCMAGVLLVLAWRDICRMFASPATQSLWTRVWEIVGYGVPIAVQLGIEVWGFVAAGLFIGWMGTTALAGHAIALLVASLSFMLPLGIGAGATTRIGNLLGAGFPWRRSGWLAIGIGAAISMVAAAVFIGFPGAIARLFTTDPEVIAVVVVLLPIAGTFQLIDGVQVTAQGVLRGLGDVRLPMLFNIIAHWGIGMPTALLFAFTLGWGPQGVWMGLVAGLFAVGVMSILRLRWLGRQLGIE